MRYAFCCERSPSPGPESRREATSPPPRGIGGYRRDLGFLAMPFPFPFPFLFPFAFFFAFFFAFGFFRFPRLPPPTADRAASNPALLLRRLPASVVLLQQLALACHSLLAP